MDDHHAQLWRARAAAVRHSPLKPLAAQLGYHKDPLNRARWKRPGAVLSITGSKFFGVFIFSCLGGIVLDRQ